jgi:hypothetical protein
MTILELRSKDAGRVMLRDLGRVDQFTNPPVTAMTMFPIAQLIVGEEVGSMDEGIGRVMLMEKSCEDCIRTVYTLLTQPCHLLEWVGGEWVAVGPGAVWVKVGRQPPGNHGYASNRSDRRLEMKPVSRQPASNL